MFNPGRRGRYIEARCQAEGEKGKAELAPQRRLTMASSAASAEKAAAERTQQALQQQLDASAAELSSANALRLEQADRIATAEAAAAKRHRACDGGGGGSSRGQHSERIACCRGGRPRGGAM